MRKRIYAMLVGGNARTEWRGATVIYDSHTQWTRNDTGREGVLAEPKIYSAQKYSVELRNEKWTWMGAVGYEIMGGMRLNVTKELRTNALTLETVGGVSSHKEGLMGL